MGPVAFGPGHTAADNLPAAPAGRDRVVEGTGIAVAESNFQVDRVEVAGSLAAVAHMEGRERRSAAAEDRAWVGRRAGGARHRGTHSRDTLRLQRGVCPSFSSCRCRFQIERTAFSADDVSTSRERKRQVV